MTATLEELIDPARVYKRAEIQGLTRLTNFKIDSHVADGRLRKLNDKPGAHLRVVGSELLRFLTTFEERPVLDLNARFNRVLDNFYANV